jgi:hypothetical protein
MASLTPPAELFDPLRGEQTWLTLSFHMAKNKISAQSVENRSKKLTQSLPRDIRTLCVFSAVTTLFSKMDRQWVKKKGDLLALNWCLLMVSSVGDGYEWAGM